MKPPLFIFAKYYTELKIKSFASAGVSSGKLYKKMLTYPDALSHLAIAEKLGISQQAISKLENSEQVEDGTLERIAGALGVSSEAIKNLSDEAVINIVSSTLHDNAGSYNSNCSLTFNPIDKWLEAIEENKKLYEALLKAEREKVALLEKMLEKK